MVTKLPNALFREHAKACTLGRIITLIRSSEPIQHRRQCPKFLSQIFTYRRSRAHETTELVLSECTDFCQTEMDHISSILEQVSDGFDRYIVT